MSQSIESIHVLPGIHVSPETAYLVDDYPYGFRLRCKIRYWLEVHPRHGVRLMSQTSNPKAANTVWNKPKSSTYAKFAGAMFLDSESHVQWSGLTEYTNGKEAEIWRETYGAGVPTAACETMDRWVNAKVAFDAKRTAGTTDGEALLAARKAFLATSSTEVA